MIPHAGLHRRQDPLSPSSFVPGISNVAVTLDNTAALTGSSLAFDASATTDPNLTTTAVVVPPPVITSTARSPATTSRTSSTTSVPTVAAAASKPIAMSTVVATCVGAFIGATALIVLAFWFYRRYSRTLKQKARTRAPLMHGRNMQGENQRRRSRLEPWNKLDDDDDKWESKYQSTKEVDQVAPMEKLTMFKKTASIRTTYTHNMDDTPLDFPPSLVQTLAEQKFNMPEPRPFLGRIDADPVISWDSDGGAKESYLSVRSRLSGGAVSPTINMAIPTPPAMYSQPHKWESAEVVHYSGGQTAHVENPFDSENEESPRRSRHNPFFGAQTHDPPPRSRSNSRSRSESRSRSNSTTSKPPPSTNVKPPPSRKGKERMRYSDDDPFQDAAPQPSLPRPLPTPKFAYHAASDSTVSEESKERALQSLMAALEVSEEEVRNRLRVASMQPSIVSEVSQYTIDGEDMTNSFPLPPSSNDSHRP